ncbi:hypothetical protein T09_4596 [Trichinella sp. T9]|nr:hypothetical protein T09_4596 [Trichinella sp. T9]
MPFDVRGCTRATMKASTELQLFPLNEEFPVSVSVLTGASSRMYSASRREISQTKSSRGSKSRNKVSVGEPAEGSSVGIQQPT